MAQCEWLVKIISGIVSEHGWGAIKSGNVLGVGRGDSVFSKQYTEYNQQTEHPDKAGDGGINH